MNLFHDIESNVSYLEGWRRRTESHKVESSAIKGRCTSCGQEDVFASQPCRAETAKMLEESALAIKGGQLLQQKLEGLPKEDQEIISLFLRRSMHKHY